MKMLAGLKEREVNRLEGFDHIACSIEKPGELEFDLR
jgi:hypothetical protein